MKNHLMTLLIAGFIGVFLFYNPTANIFSQANNKLKTMNNSLKMQCEVKGEGNPIVLVGGGLTGWKSWESFVEFFNSQQRRVIRLQLVSVEYGLENRLLPDGYSIKAESGAMSATLDSLDLKAPVDIVAWSFGGFTSLDYALNHPDRIRSLTLIEPPAMWVLRETGKFDEKTRQSADFFQKFSGDITEDMLAEFLTHAGLVPPGHSARELPQWNGWLPFRQSLRNCPAVVTFRDNLKRLENFQSPVLLVKGTGSTAWLHQVIDGLAENMPHSRVVEFAGGHAPHIVSRDAFLAELNKFQATLK